eukprot:556396_1
MNQCENVTGNDETKPQQPQEHGMDAIAVYQAEVYGNKQLLLQKKQTNEKPCVRDKLCGILALKYEKNKTNKDGLKQFVAFLEGEEYDTDAIADDLEFKYEA